MYKKVLGTNAEIPPLRISEDAHGLVKNTFTHLFFEPGEGYFYGSSIYCVQLLVERLGGKNRYVEYADEYIFGTLGLNSSTYLPAQVPHVWERRLQMVERKLTEDGKPHLIANGQWPYGLTCSISDICRIFGDLLSEDCKLLTHHEHRDMLFLPQLKSGSTAHQAFLADPVNYGFAMPLDHNIPYQELWTLTPHPKVNWTVAGALIEEDNTLPNTNMPKGTVTFEGLPNLIWTMNREKGRMMMFATQILPDYDVKAHNLASQFLRDAWKVFG